MEIQNQTKQEATRRVFRITLGESHCAPVWRPRTTSFDELCDKLLDPVRTNETVAEYQAMTRPERTACKDHGGFVAGTFSGTERKQKELISRSMLTLDVDHAEPDFPETYKALAEYTSVLYSTHSHTPAQPRFRLLVPLTRDVSPDEYVAISRYFANDWDIDQFDPCSWVIHQPMFWPSCPKDGEYICERFDRRLLNPDEYLAQHPEWRDCSKLPTRSDEKAVRPLKVSKENANSKESDSSGGPIQVQDPTGKEGVVGAFCRCYNIEDAINTFLPDVYQPAESVPGRYEYIPADSKAGVVLFDGKWAYSHHATDPAYGRMLNAFDLVRVHKFPDANEKKSFHDMANFALGLDAIKQRFMDEKAEATKKAFADSPLPQAGLPAAETESMGNETKIPSAEDGLPSAGRESSAAEAGLPASESDPNSMDAEPVPAENAESMAEPEAAAEAPAEASEEKPAERENPRDWHLDLVYNQMGELKNSAINAQLILENDPECNRFAYNEMAGTVEVIGRMPWNRPPCNRFWRNADETQLMVWMDKKYITFSKRNYDAAFTNAADNRRYHPVRDYLDSLPAWDGVPRVESLLIDTMQAEDTPYVRAVTRKALTAAIGRIYRPGLKFDNILVLDGPQGIGKSTLFKELAGEQNYNEGLSLTDMNDNKVGGEKLQGIWIAEIPELAGMKKMDIEKVKAFVSATDDRYRNSYGHWVESHPRQSIMIATVNGERGYLRDTTGNRRFWIVKLGQKEPGKRWSLSAAERDQIWAEAKQYWQNGEKLYLEADLLAAAETAQQGAMEKDERAGMVEAYLDTPLPDDWDTMPLYERIRYLHDKEDPNDRSTWKKQGTVRRTTVSNHEIWCECFGYDKQTMNKKASYEMADIMATIPGWKRSDTLRVLPLYGRERVYERQNP